MIETDYFNIPSEYAIVNPQFDNAKLTPKLFEKFLKIKKSTR